MTELPVDAISERMIDLGGLLVRLGEDRELVAELAGALDDEDTRRFAAALKGSLPGLDDLPPEECHSYVQVVALVVRPAKFVRRCVKKSNTITSAQGETITGVVAAGTDMDRFLKTLSRLKLIECPWHLEDQSRLLVIEKYVQGMCP